jgi:Uncharacterized protein conserved in bacteria (DUF2252)
MKPQGPASFEEATSAYRAWLGARVTITDDEWAKRRRVLADCSPFEFFRATFYRWAQWWPVVCGDLDSDGHPGSKEEVVPQVLGVGDLHVENFGTWRDAEGRLVWGINDFDEACCLPYTHDLVRLAASARFAIEEQHQKDADRKGTADPETDASKRQAAADRDFRAACRSLLEGYGDALDPAPRNVGRRPFILAEDKSTAWLRDIVMNKLRAKDDDSEFSKFLESLRKLSSVQGQVPESAWHALRHAMPDDAHEFRVGHREAGLGSLGRQRFTAVVDDWHGGVLAREAKALAPSAWRWWTKEGARNTSYLYMTVLGLAVRSRDPAVSVFEGDQTWVVRRLAPDSGRVKLGSLPQAGHLEDDLLQAMGHETANVHVPLGNVRRDLEHRTKKDPDWLYHAGGKMADRVVEDLAESR